MNAALGLSQLRELPRHLAVRREIGALFLATPFEGGRHQRRVDQLMAIEAEEAQRTP